MIDQPPYLRIAWRQLDVAEIPGPEDNPKILAYHDATDGGEAPDEVSWCSSFVNWCMKVAGEDRTRSKAARSWLAWGVDCEPEYGCVAVLWRVDPKGWQGHVGFLVGMESESIYLLGGNQSNRVRVSRYPASRVLGYRRAA
jgi:uncharacterized protein (TIGR02594 family)